MTAQSTRSDLHDRWVHTAAKLTDAAWQRITSQVDAEGHSRFDPAWYERALKLVTQ